MCCCCVLYRAVGLLLAGAGGCNRGVVQGARGDADGAAGCSQPACRARGGVVWARRGSRCSRGSTAVKDCRAASAWGRGGGGVMCVSMCVWLWRGAECGVWWRGQSSIAWCFITPLSCMLQPLDHNSQGHKSQACRASRLGSLSVQLLLHFAIAPTSVTEWYLRRDTEVHMLQHSWGIGGWSPDTGA